MARTTTTARITATLALGLAALVLGGCAGHYDRYYSSSGHYPDSRVQYGGHYRYGRSPAHSGRGYRRYSYRPVNPAVYPYWSLDYFYFSRFYHPYSVFVGYHEPLYYPYPGWALGHHRSRHYRSHHRGGYRSGFSIGFGYPWHGYGHRYPHFSLGFFARHEVRHGGHRSRGHRRGHHGGHRSHPIRHIDRRLAELQHHRIAPSRRALLAREAGGRTAGQAAGQAPRTAPPRSGRHEDARRHSRSRLLQNRDSRSIRARPEESRSAQLARLRALGASRDASGQASRRNDRRNDQRSERRNERRNERRGDEIRRRARSEPPAFRGTLRSIRQSASRQRDSNSGRRRQPAGSESGRSGSRGSLIRRAEPAPGRQRDSSQRGSSQRDSSQRDSSQRSTPSRASRADSPPPERASRGSSRRASSRDRDRTSSRRDRLRERSDGRRRR